MIGRMLIRGKRRGGCTNICVWILISRFHRFAQVGHFRDGVGKIELELGDFAFERSVFGDVLRDSLWMKVRLGNFLNIVFFFKCLIGVFEDLWIHFKSFYRVTLVWHDTNFLF